MAGKDEIQKVAIVGGGIAGLFCAYILGKRGIDVDLFEATDRLGGRIRTIRLGQRRDNIRTNVEVLKRHENQSLKDFLRSIADSFEFHVEFGAMRFNRKKHKLLDALLAKLGLDEHMKDFSSYTSPPSAHDPKYELNSSELGKDAYQLLQLAIMRIITRVVLVPDKGQKEKVFAFEKCREAFLREIPLAAAMGEDPLKKFIAIVKSMPEEAFWEIQRYGHISLDHWPPGEKPVPLFTLGFWNLLSPHLSHDGMTKVRDLGAFFHLIPDNPNAAEWLAWWLRGLAIGEDLQWVDEGMETITEELVTKLREGTLTERVSINLNARVIELLPTESSDIEDGIKLKILRTSGRNRREEVQGVSYEAVILALPKSPLRKVALRSAGIFNIEQDKMEVYLDSSYGFPLAKAFFVVRNRWWEEEARANQDATRVPTREIHYWKGRSSKQGLIMIYTDRPAAAFWGNFVMSGPHEDVGWTELNDMADVKKLFSGNKIQEVVDYKQKDHLKSELVRYLNENGLPNFKKEDILWVGIRDWNRDPYGGGNHAWRPKRRYWYAMRRLARLEVNVGEKGESAVPRPRAQTPCVCVCGEAYSDYHGFIEGALRSAVYALSGMLNDQDLSYLDDLLKEPGGEYREGCADYKQALKDWIADLSDLPDRPMVEELY